MPKLFLIDPQAAIVCLCPEIAETLSRIFATDARTLKHYLIKDENQLAAVEIARIVQDGNEAI